MLGELQFAFIGFYIGESFECFEHWKELVLLLAMCQDAYLDRTKAELFYHFIRTFRYQLHAAPSDFFDEFAGANFLVSCLKVRACVLVSDVELRDNRPTTRASVRVSLQNLHEVVLQDQSVDSRVRQEATTLLQLCEQRFGRSFNPLEYYEADEDAPVVVDL